MTPVSHQFALVTLSTLIRRCSQLEQSCTDVKCHRRLARQICVRSQWSPVPPFLSLSRQLIQPYISTANSRDGHRHIMAVVVVFSIKCLTFIMLKDPHSRHGECHCLEATPVSLPPHCQRLVYPPSPSVSF